MAANESLFRIAVDALHTLRPRELDCIADGNGHQLQGPDIIYRRENPGAKLTKNVDGNHAGIRIDFASLMSGLVGRPSFALSIAISTMRTTAAVSLQLPRD